MIDKLKKIYSFYKEIISSRGIILKLAKNDFRTKYASSYLGTVWAFIQPLVIIVMYFLVFQFGLRTATTFTTSTGNFPYVLWLICGIIPWFYFSEAMITGANSLVDYSYLVKKMVFKISILPVVKITSSFFTHIFFIFFIFFMFFIFKHNPNMYNIQFLYYSLCMYLLVAGISLFTSSILVFFKDMGQIITILMNIGFWATPIIWSTDRLAKHPFLGIIFEMNPMYYIVQGYRDTFMNGIWFWNRGFSTLYFWAFTIFFLIVGQRTFKNLKPHFSDVL